MAEKEKTDFVCEKCGTNVERQHWGIAEDLTAYQDRLTCSDITCGYVRIVKCIHKNLNQEKKEVTDEGKNTA